MHGILTFLLIIVGVNNLYYTSLVDFVDGVMDKQTTIPHNKICERKSLA
jgi:hypothetical protein